MIGSKIGPKQTLWQKYGKQLLLCTLALVIGYGGFQYYRSYETKQAEKASLAYDNMLTLMRNRDIEKAKVEAESLTKQYPKTPYASLAALLLAKFNIDENKLEPAIENLKLAMKNDKEGPVHQIARVRLARVMAAQKNYTEALSLLTPAKIPDGYATLFEETKGDIYLMQNDKDKARVAYQAAQKAAPPGAPVARLQLKQTDLGSN